MKKQLSYMLFVVMFLVLLIPSNIAHAQETDRLFGDDLIPYTERLDQLNKEFGTAYAFSPMQGNTMESLEEFITSMTLDEFENYVRDAHESSLVNESAATTDTSINTRDEDDNGLNRDTPFLATQRCITDPIYGGIDVQNYFYITIYTNYVNGQYIYVNNYTSSGTVINHYPGYDSYGSYGVLGGNNTYIEVTYTCARRITEQLINTNNLTITVRYYAGQGDLWPVT